MSDNRVAIAEEFRKQLEGFTKKKFHFLLIGRTGVGKSSTVNNLLGKQVARVGDYEPTTMEIEHFDSEIDGIQFTVIDTPGLCDEIEDTNNEKYIGKIRSNVKKIDCLWFVTELSATRVTSDEKRGIRLITESLSPKIWEHAIIIFTFADKVPKERYMEAFAKRTELIKAEIAKSAPGIAADGLPSVAVDNSSKLTPDGKEWLGELFVKVFSIISDKGAIPFLMATASSLNPNSSGQARINLDETQKNEVKKIIDAKIIPSLAATGVALGVSIGAFAGPLGSAIGAGIGGAVGATIGLVAWLFG
jgi:predicted GTPase